MNLNNFANFDEKNKKVFGTFIIFFLNLFYITFFSSTYSFLQPVTPIKQITNSTKNNTVVLPFTVRVIVFLLVIVFILLFSYYLFLFIKYVIIYDAKIIYLKIRIIEKVNRLSIKTTQKTPATFFMIIKTIIIFLKHT